MIRKNLKLTIVSLSLSISLAMGTAAYAYTDAGATLQEWGKSRIQLAKHEINGVLQQETLNARQELNQVKDEGVAHAGTQIEQTAANASHNVSQHIGLAQQAYEAQLNGIVSDLSKSGRVDFELYVQDSSIRMSKEIEGWASETIQGLTEQLGN